MKIRSDWLLAVLVVIAIWYGWSSGILAKLTQAGAIYPPVSMVPSTNMSLPGSETLSKFTNALTGSVPAQPPTLNDLQGAVAPANVQPFAASGAAPAAVQPAPNYVNPAVTIGKNDFSNPNSPEFKEASAAAAKANAAYIVLTPPAQGKWANADTNASGYAQNNAAVQANIAAGAQVRMEVQQVTGDKLLFTPAGWFRCIIIHSPESLNGTENDRQLWFSLPIELRQKGFSLCTG